MSITEIRLSEYEALRATIRERGTSRIYVVLAGLAAWGALTIALLFAELQGGVTLVPFMILATTFELNLFVHTGVERIGRYIQVFFEEAGNLRGWETTVINYGTRFPAPRLTLRAPRWSSGGLDPLFVTAFSASAAVNFFSLLASASRRPGWIAISLIAHSLFAYRIVTARKAAASQRELDLDRFRKLLEIGR